MIKPQLTSLAVRPTEAGHAVAHACHRVAGRTVEAVAVSRAVEPELSCRTRLAAGGADVPYRTGAVTRDDITGRPVPTATHLLTVGAVPSLPAA